MRLIDADAEFLVTANYGCGITECYRITVAEYLGENMNKIPTIDAVPVVHGDWIIKPHGTYGQLRAFCSACGKHSGIGGIVSNQKKPYCPNCGAKMDGEQ